jgi:methylthioribose-1-phosphate isomerase
VNQDVAPLRWEGGSLLVLDQRRLPGEEAWVRCAKCSS